MELLTFTPFPGQGSSAWVAVDGDGILYSSEFNTEGIINRFALDWASFQADGEHTPPTLTKLEPVSLRGEAGTSLELPHAQGGASDDGRRFYLSNGNGTGDADPQEGLHVFLIQTATGVDCDLGLDACLVARRIERSHNSDDPGFSFEFHPGLNIGPSFQEPEGLTYWDLGSRGQLHVVLLDNDHTDVFGANDEVFVKHYAFTDVDSDPPVIACPAPVTAECVSPPASHQATRSWLPSLPPFATDACSLPRIDHNAPAAFPLGTTPVTFTATDRSGNASACRATVTVVDTTPPTISVALSHDTLWPPNHALVRVTARVTLADTCGPHTFELVSISSNEPDEDTDDGDTSVDIRDVAFGTADTSFLLRAERSGAGQGRDTPLCIEPPTEAATRALRPRSSVYRTTGDAAAKTAIAATRDKPSRK